MGRIFGKIMMTLCCTILLAASVQAKTLKEVYLKDGGIIKCQKVWQANGKVKVLVNRELLVDLSREEVNLKKTFARKPAMTGRKAKSGKKAASEPGAVKPPGVPQPVVAPVAEQKPEAHPKIAAKPAAAVEKPAAPAVKPVPPEANKPAPKGVKPAPPAVKPPAPEPVKAAPPAAGQQAAPAEKPAAPATEASPVRANLPIAQPPLLPEKAPSALPKETGLVNGIIMLLLLIVMIVSFCMIFAKAGEAWWKAIIPIYSWFVLVIIAGKPWWWGLLIFIPIVNIAIYFMINIALAKRFGQGVVFGLGLALLGFVFFPLLAFGKYEYS